ncbi:hypothetical protein J6590_073435 [Homalodisca vitripennis]|nr:hypothetical protein J6590_094083 [Homalodisca vitripennis]KAG8295722.1 hypothetical protein J6590_073435 [Homalodisca vitripennis]
MVEVIVRPTTSPFWACQERRVTSSQSCQPLRSGRISVNTPHYNSHISVKVINCCKLRVASSVRPLTGAGTPGTGLRMLEVIVRPTTSPFWACQERRVTSSQSCQPPRSGRISVNTPQYNSHISVKMINCCKLRVASSVRPLTGAGTPGTGLRMLEVIVRPTTSPFWACQERRVTSSQSCQPPRSGRISVNTPQFNSHVNYKVIKCCRLRAASSVRPLTGAGTPGTGLRMLEVIVRPTTSPFWACQERRVTSSQSCQPPRSASSVRPLTGAGTPGTGLRMVEVIVRPTTSPFWACQERRVTSSQSCQPLRSGRISVNTPHYNSHISVKVINCCRLRVASSVRPLTGAGTPGTGLRMLEVIVRPTTSPCWACQERRVTSSQSCNPHNTHHKPPHTTPHISHRAPARLELEHLELD